MWCRKSKSFALGQVAPVRGNQRNQNQINLFLVQRANNC